MPSHSRAVPSALAVWLASITYSRWGDLIVAQHPTASGTAFMTSPGSRVVADAVVKAIAGRAGSEIWAERVLSAAPLAELLAD